MSLLCSQTEGVTKSLAARDDFVLFLFTLMTNKKTFLQTATLIEDILGVKKVNVSTFSREILQHSGRKDFDLQLNVPVP